MTHECPTCDYTSETQMGISVHHYKAHGESIAKSTYECDVCVESVERYDCNVNGGIVYCSKDCEATHKSERPPEEHPKWMDVDRTVECATCGEEKQVSPYQLERSERFFCGSECFGEWRSKNIRGPRSPSYNSVQVECDWCGETTTKVPSRIDRSEQDFCSHDCHNKWMSEHQHGPNHHQWAGGRRDYGPGWNEQKREKVRQRDNRECQDCEISEAESIADYGRKLDVHHLVPPSSDTNPAVHNATRNLITLCVRCHHEWESDSHPNNPVEVAAEVSKV